MIEDQEPPEAIWTTVRMIYNLYSYPVKDEEVLNEFAFLRSDDLSALYKELKSKGFKYIRPKRATPNAFPSVEGEAVRKKWLKVPGNVSGSAYCGICKKDIVTGPDARMIVCNMCRQKLIWMINPNPDDIYDIFVGSRGEEDGKR